MGICPLRIIKFQYNILLSKKQIHFSGDEVVRTPGRDAHIQFVTAEVWTAQPSRRHGRPRATLTVGRVPTVNVARRPPPALGVLFYKTAIENTML